MSFFVESREQTMISIHQDQDQDQDQDEDEHHDEDQDEHTRLLPGRSGDERPNFFLQSSYASIGEIQTMSTPDQHMHPYLPSVPDLSQPQPMGRKMSRIRTNSVSILNDDGDDVIGTSYGPVVMDHAPSSNLDWLLGWFLAIISGILFTANNFFVKYLSIEALEMLTVRSVMQTVVILIALVSTRTPILPPSNKDRVLVVLQGLLSGVRVFLQFACLSFMPLGDALTLVFTEPLWTIILSKIILKINIGWWKTIFGVFLLSGMVLCIQPPFIFHPLNPTNSTTNSSDIHNQSAYTPTPYAYTPLDVTTLHPTSQHPTAKPASNWTNMVESNRPTATVEQGYFHPLNPHSEPEPVSDISPTFEASNWTNMTESSERTAADQPINKRRVRRNLLHKFKQITGLARLQAVYANRRKEGGEDEEGDGPGTDRYYILSLIHI
jgi:hypothetical protein